MKNYFHRIIWVVVIISLCITFVKTVPTTSAAGNISQKEANLQTNNSLAATKSVYLPAMYGQFPTSTVFGVEMAWGISLAGGLNEMAQAGSNWVRKNAIIWSKVETYPGERTWNGYTDAELINAHQRNMDVVLIIRGAPSWAQKYPGYVCGPVAEKYLPNMATFLHDVVARYSVAPYYVKYFEIWNEPDIDPYANILPPDEFYGCWGDVDDPFYGGEYYGEMLNLAYPSMKAANPDAQVLLGGLLLDCNPNPPVNCSNPAGKFLAGILEAGAGSSFDGVSFHAYDYTTGFQGTLGRYANNNWVSAWNTTGPVVEAKVNFIRNVLAQYNVQGKYLMNTESGLITWDDKGCDDVCQQNKAYYVAQVFPMAISLDLKVNNWFGVFSWRNSGLLSNPDRTPYPAYYAYKFARYELSNSKPMSSSIDYPNVKKYELDRGTKHIWVLWSLDGNPHNITLPGTPLAIWDIYGNAVSITNPLPVTLMPYYIEWNP